MSDAARSFGTIRVGLAGFAGLNAESVRGCLAGHRDIAIVTELPTADALNQAPANGGMDVLITTCPADGVADACRRQLFDRGVPVIAIADDGRLEVFDRKVVRTAALAELLAEVRRVASR